MSDERHDCPNRVVPFLIGGALGAALAHDANRENAARIRREIDVLAALERERLAQEEQRLALAQTEAQRDEADRTYRQSVLWLEHCNNDERLEWFVRGHGAALADELTVRVIAEARQRAEIVTLFDDVRAARHAMEASEMNQRGREVQRNELRWRRWTGGSIWFVCAAVGLAILIPLWAHFGAEAVGGYVLFLAVCAGISPLVVRWQPTPKDLAPQIPGIPFSGSLREAIERVEEAIGETEAEISSATMEHALARETIVQAFRAMQPALLAEASRCLSAIRARIDALQVIYPPRIRCELAAVSDATLQTQLAPHFRAALEQGGAAII